MQPYFFIRTDNQCVKINFTDIAYVEANRNYVRIVAHNRVYLVLLSLKQLETILPSNSFCRVHRSFIVSLDCVVSFDQECMYLKVGQEHKKSIIPIGNQYRKFLHQNIMLVASEVRQGVKLSSVNIESLMENAKN